MSLSDQDEFKPLVLSSLEQVDGEQTNRINESNPDFNRLESLFEKPKFQDKESYEFKMLYDAKKEEKTIVFKPLIEKKEKTEKKIRETDSSSGAGSQEPMETDEKKGYRKGFARGLEEGQKKGFEQGVEEGEAKGLEIGKNQGFEKGEKQGFDHGLKEGLEKGEEETRQKAVKILNSLETSLKEADQTLDLLVEKYEDSIVSLIQKIARKAVLAQVEINDEIVKHMILDALKHLVQPEEVVLSVSLDDYEYIERIKDGFFEQVESLKSISVKPDPSIKKGGCRIDTNTASVSTDAQSRLDSIFEAMKTAGAK